MTLIGDARPLDPSDDPGTPIADELEHGPSSSRFHPDNTEIMPMVTTRNQPPSPTPKVRGSEPAAEDDVPEDESFSAQLARARQRPDVAARQRSEGSITAEVLEWLNAQPLSFARKVHQGAMSGGGEPDIDACIQGRAVKIEMKRPGETPTDRQMRRLQKWQQAGALVGWACSLADAQAIVARLRDPQYRNALVGPGA